MKKVVGGLYHRLPDGTERLIGKVTGFTLTNNLHPNILPTMETLQRSASVTFTTSWRDDDV